MGKVYRDVYNIEHENCKIVNTLNAFERVFIIEDPNGSRFTCLKENPPMSNKSKEHWKYGSPKDAPSDYAIPYNLRQHRTN